MPRWAAHVVYCTVLYVQMVCAFYLLNRLFYTRELAPARVGDSHMFSDVWRDGENDTLVWSPANIS